jgi:5-methylcytosine-specific restriction endonuclease McrA
MPTGIYTRTEEYCKIMSKTMKGRKFTPEWREKIRIALTGKNNPLFGKHQPLETIIKRSKSMLGNKNACKFGDSILTPEYKRKWNKEYYQRNIDKMRRIISARSGLRRELKSVKNYKEVIKTIQRAYEDNIKKYGTLTCYLCLKPIDFKKDSLEHKIPLSRGGTNEYENLAIAHLICNQKKQNKTESEYRKEI